MAKLIYAAITSLDGYVADDKGDFDWAEPDDEVHTFINDLERSVGTHLLGRRMYEVLAVWETLDVADQPLYIRDFADMWRAADKVVYSTTLPSVSSGRTRFEPSFEAEAIRRWKAEAERDIAVGGPNLAAHALKAQLVDEIHWFIAPVVVGGGLSFFPDGIRLQLDLLDERRFGNGMVHLRYRTLP